MQVRTFLPLDDLPRRTQVLDSNGHPCISAPFDHPHALVARRDGDNEDTQVLCSCSYLLDQEIEVGLISIAVPVRNVRGVLLGAISVGVPLVRTSAEVMQGEILPKLLETTAAISKALKT